MAWITPGSTLAIVLLTVILVVAIWDIIALNSGRGNDTVSMIIGNWSREFPMLAIGVGIVIGHLFWPRGPRLP